MNNRIKNPAVFLIIFLWAAVAPAKAEDDSTAHKEHQIKAAFLYNIINFVEWPEETKEDADKPIIIGVIGNEQFSQAFTAIKDKQIKNRKVIVKYIAGFEEANDKSNPKDNPDWKRKIAELKKCHLLMFCSHDTKEIKNAAEVIKELSGSPILTAGETSGFLEKGGIINFLLEDKKVRFEINLASAKRSQLKISVKLLKLAKRVIE